MAEDEIGLPFQKGFDPRRAISTGRTPEYELTKLKGEARVKLISKLCEFLNVPDQKLKDFVEDLAKDANEPATVGDKIVAKSLLKVLQDEPTFDNITKILKVLGHKFEEPAQVNINMSLESLVADAHIEPEEKVVEAANGAKVIVRRKRDEGNNEADSG